VEAKPIRASVGRHLVLLGLMSWVLVTWISESVLPDEPGPFSERPFARALLIGGAVGMTLMIVDLFRNPRRVWLWGLVLWGAILCLSAWSGAVGDDSDIEQVIGWGVLLGGVIGLPLILANMIAFALTRASRAIQDRPRRWRVSVDEDSIELGRSKEVEDQR
jgi:hypothetical protein